MSAMLTDAPLVEDARTQLRRRLQQKKCLVCGAHARIKWQPSYFCLAHADAYRFCSLCETVRAAESHGKDSRCRVCGGARSLGQYYADPDRTLYRLRLKQIASRRSSRADQIFAGMRGRIALADLVRATPGLSWTKRAAIIGGYASNLATAYRLQSRGLLYGVDHADRARTRRRKTQ